jgi:hypothetical protein
VEISLALAADLAALTVALDEPGANIETTLRQLGSDAKAAVASYLGLTVSAGVALFTTMDDHRRSADIHASLMMPLHRLGSNTRGARFVVVLYATTPGAFTDLSADLAWVTGLPLAAFVIDQHLSVDADLRAGGFGHAGSVVNQAIGVLIGRGRTPEQASDELDALAAVDGHSQHDAARALLAGLRRSAPDPSVEPQLD